MIFFGRFDGPVLQSALMEMYVSVLLVLICFYYEVGVISYKGVFSFASR